VRQPVKVSHDSRDTGPAGAKYRTKSEILTLSIARFMRYWAGLRAETINAANCSQQRVDRGMALPTALTSAPWWVHRSTPHRIVPSIALMLLASRIP